VTAPPPLDSLLPQRGPARLVERLVEERDDGVTCAGHAPQDAGLLRDGRVPGFAALELAAQAAAVFEGLRRWRSEGRPRTVEGYLVGLSEVRIEQPELDPGAPLVARVRQLEGIGPLARYEVHVSQGERPCASGQIRTYLAPGARAGAS
jgi:predicted hotdog family 3-hydroxylacyl-ACP dehydratase